MVDVTPYPKVGKKPPARRRPIPFASPKRLAEKEQRADLREAVKDRDQVCVGPARGLPGACRSDDLRRPRLEVNETHKRSTHPGSHLDEDKAVLMCQFHHSMITSPVGEIRELAEASGLLVRNSTPITPHARDEPVRAGSQDRETPE